MKRKRHCLEPGCVRLTTGTRCTVHEAQRQRRRNAKRTHYGHTWQVTSAQLLAAHRATYGNWCPGAADLEHQAHYTADLTVDHVQNRTLQGGLRVLCRSANSRKGALDQHRTVEHWGYDP